MTDGFPLQKVPCSLSQQTIESGCLSYNIQRKGILNNKKWSASRIYCADKHA